MDCVNLYTGELPALRSLWEAAPHPATARDLLACVGAILRFDEDNIESENLEAAAACVTDEVMQAASHCEAVRWADHITHLALRCDLDPGSAADQARHLFFKVDEDLLVAALLRHHGYKAAFAEAAEDGKNAIFQYLHLFMGLRHMCRSHLSKFKRYPNPLRGTGLLWIRVIQEAEFLEGGMR